MCKHLLILGSFLHRCHESLVSECAGETSQQVLDGWLRTSAPLIRRRRRGRRGRRRRGTRRRRRRNNTNIWSQFLVSLLAGPDDSRAAETVWSASEGD